MGDQFSEEYRRGFADALKAAVISANLCSDLEGSSAYIVHMVVDRIEDITPEVYAIWQES